MREHLARLLDACDREGRDPATLGRIYLIGNSAERPLASLAAFEDFVGRQAELGFSDIVFHDPRPDDPVWCDDPAIVPAIAERFGLAPASPTEV